MRKVNSKICRELYESPQVFLVRIKGGGVILTSGKIGSKPEGYDIDDDDDKFEW